MQNGMEFFASRGKQKFLEVHGIEHHMGFLGGDEYVFRVFPDRNQRTGLDVVIASIGHKGFYSFASPWESLHFIKDDKRTAARKRRFVVGAEVAEKGIEAVKPVFKKITHFASGLTEVYD